MTTSLSIPAPSRASKKPAASSTSDEQVVTPLRPEATHAPIKGEELQRKHQLIEILLERHEKMIDIRLGRFIKQYPEIGEDSVRSTFYMKLVKRCINRNDLLALQSDDLQPLNPQRERQIIGGMIKFTKLEELRRLYHQGRHTRPFSQLNEYDPGQIPGRTSTQPQPAPPRSLAVRIADRLTDLNLDLSDRQFNILLCRLENKKNPGKVNTHEEIASQLDISSTTVKREIGKITKMILSARGVMDQAEAPATVARREDFKQILAAGGDLKPQIKDFLEAYVKLTENGQRPTEEHLREMLGLTPGQLKNRQRVAARLRPGLLHQVTE